MNFAIYCRTTGEILRIVTCHPEQLDPNVVEGESALLCDDSVSDITHWVDDLLGLIEVKSDYHLDNLPLPCTVIIEGVEYHCVEQPEFEFDAPGAYSITVDAGPRYLKKEFNIENTPLLA